MKYFLDTNVFLRMAAVDDKRELLVCKEILNKARQGEIQAVTSGIVLAELNWVLRTYYHFPKDRQVRILEDTLHLSGLDFTDEYNWRLAVQLYKTINIKYIDAAIASIPQIAGGEWTVVSYDEDFRKLPVKWVKPGEL